MIKRIRKYFISLMQSKTFSTTRLDAFSDGVFAIVITLLILELRVPEAHGPQVSRDLAAGLQAMVPKFVSFVVSFLYITMYWINHHHLFHMLKQADRGLFWLNSLFLMCLTIIPFPTAMIGSYPHEPLAVIAYGLTMFFSALTFVLMKVYIYRCGHLIAGKKSLRSVSFYLWAGPMLYLLSSIAALWSVMFAIVIYIIIPILYFFAGGVED